MKKITYAFVCCWLLGLAVQAQDRQETKKETRSLGNFSEVSINSSVDAILVQGSSNKIEIEAKGIATEYVTTSVKDGKLVVNVTKSNDQRKKGFDLEEDKKIKKGMWRNNYTVKVKLTYQSLESLSAAGASSIKVEGTLKADKLTLSAMGASDVRANVQTNLLDVTAMGASDVKITGTARNQKVKIAGASDFSAYELQSEDAEVNASGASDAKISVSKSLKAYSSGASDITYVGEPEVKESVVRGASDITQKRK